MEVVSAASFGEILEAKIHIYNETVMNKGHLPVIHLRLYFIHVEGVIQVHSFLSAFSL